MKHMHGANNCNKLNYYMCCAPDCAHAPCIVCLIKEVHILSQRSQPQRPLAVKEFMAETGLKVEHRLYRL